MQFDTSYLTAAGREIATTDLGGLDQIQYTKAVASSDDYSSLAADDLRKLTNLDGVEQTVAYSKILKKDTTTLTLRVDFPSEDVKTAYELYTVGLYAKLKSGDEVLYAVLPSDTPDQISAYDGKSNVNDSFTINTTVSNTSDVDFSLTAAGTLTESDLDTIFVSRHIATIEDIDGKLKDYYTKSEVDAKFVTDDDFASKLPKNIATTDAANTFTKSQTFAGGATDGKGNAYATTKDVATGLNNGLSTKVNVSDMRKPASDVAGIDEVNAKADDSKVSILQTQVDNSAVGINILTGTSDFSSNWIGQSSVSTTTEYNGCPSMVFTSSNQQLALQHLGLGKLENSFQYTSTFWAKADNAGDKARTLLWGSIKPVDFVLTTNWVRYTAVVTSFPDANTNIDHSMCFFGVPDGNKGNVYIALPKLEKGIVATDWCPNSEDKVNVSDMRKPASDVAGIEEVNAKQDKIGYTPADDSKVVHDNGDGTVTVDGQTYTPANDVYAIKRNDAGNTVGTVKIPDGNLQSSNGLHYYPVEWFGSYDEAMAYSKTHPYIDCRW